MPARCAGSEKSTEKTTAVFKLDIRCSWQPDATMAHEKGAAPSSGHWLQRMAAAVLCKAHTCMQSSACSSQWHFMCLSTARCVDEM